MRKAFAKGFSLSLSFHLHRNGGSLFVHHKSTQLTYRIWTNYKVVTYYIIDIVANFQPNRTEVDFPIGLVRYPPLIFLELQITGKSSC